MFALKKCHVVAVFRAFLHYLLFSAISTSIKTFLLIFARLDSCRSVDQMTWSISINLYLYLIKLLKYISYSFPCPMISSLKRQINVLFCHQQTSLLTLDGQKSCKYFFRQTFSRLRAFATINSISYVIRLLRPYIDTGVRLAIIV